MMKGIDVAKWNGVIDWAKVKKAGVEFAVLKVIDKSNKTESSFVRNYAGASAQGLPLDVYNYLYTSSPKKTEKPLPFLIFHGLFFVKSTNFTIFALLLKLERQL